MMLMRVVLPEPDGPNSAMTRALAANSALSVKASSLCVTFTSIIRAACKPRAGLAREKLGEQQRGHGDDDGE